MRTCTSCGLTKPLTEYFANARQAGGFYTHCKVCHSRMTTEAAERRIQTLEGRAKYMLRMAARRADVTVSWSELAELLTPGTCSATGIPLDWTRSYPAGPWSPSLDRIDPSRGYVSGNVRIVCWAYNRAKNVDGDDVVLTMARAIVEKHRG